MSDNKWKRYRRSGFVELRPYDPKESLNNIYVDDDDLEDLWQVHKKKRKPGFVARNPDNHNEQWYVSRKDAKQQFDLSNPEDIGSQQ